MRPEKMPDRQELSVIASVVCAQTETELFACLQTAAVALGFERALFGMQLNQPMMAPVQHVASAWPDPYQKLYASRGMLLRDPAVHHALGSDDLLIWDESMYSADSYDIMEESRRHKIGFGMSMPIHEGKSVHSMLSLARDQQISDPVERQRLSDGARVLAHCMHVATAKLIKPSLLAQAYPKLTPRELECLQWAAQGKSSGVTADLLNVTESVVKFHLKNTFAKLRVSNKPMAVALGVSLGLIT
jgi:DNA-binding CsgD family transcriptional regulator